MDEPPNMIREPIWVAALAKERLDLIESVTTPESLAEYQVVLSPLRDAPPGYDLEKWDRTCDNCGTYVPPGTRFTAGVCGREVHGRQVVLSYGACATCLPPTSSN